jgi:hypothetical protein
MRIRSNCMVLLENVIPNRKVVRMADPCKPVSLFLFSLALAACTCLRSSTQQTNDPLLAGFQNPPDSAKPRVWWHWMKGTLSNSILEHS